MVEYKNLHKDIKNQYDEVNILSDKIKTIKEKKVTSQREFEIDDDKIKNIDNLLSKLKQIQTSELKKSNMKKFILEINNSINELNNLSVNLSDDNQKIDKISIHNYTNISNDNKNKQIIKQNKKLKLNNNTKDFN